MKFPLLIVSVVLGAASAVADWSAAALAAPDRAPRPLSPAQPGDDVVAPLEPRQPRTERQEDRVRSMTLYAAARMADRASSYPHAMTLYARAYRYNPENIDAMRRAMLLARVLGRHTMSARYASVLVEQTPLEPLDLLRAVLYLRQEGHTADALSAYERALAERGQVAAGPAFVELHKQAGELYFQEKKYPQAADAYVRVEDALQKPAAHGLDPETLKLVQGDADALLSRIFEAYFRAGRYPQATDVVARLAKASGDEGQELYARARLAAEQKQYEDALRLLDKYLEKRLASEGDAPYQLLRDVLTVQKRTDQLKPRLQRAFALDGGNQALGCFLAAQYQADGQLTEARALYEKLLARKPSTAGYQGLVGVLRKDGQIGPLLTALGNAIASTGSLSILGDEAVRVSADNDLQRKLVTEAERRLKQQPAELKPGERLALALFSCNAKQYDVAAKYFELALQADPEQKGSLLTTWGLALIAGEQYAAAVDTLQRALDERVVPADNPTLNYYLAAALAMVGRNDAALVAARKAAVATAPAELASRVGWVHYRAKQYDEAAKAYTELIQRFDSVHDAPGVRDTMREARMTLSHIRSLQGNNDQAVELLEQVLDEFPDYVGVLNDLGYLWADQGQHLQRSLAMIQKAVTAEPKNAAYRDSLGWIYYRLGRYDDAVKELENAAAVEKPDATVLDHLGDALDKAGRKADALAAWQRALKSFDNDDGPAHKAMEEKIRAARQPRASGM